MVLQNLLVGWCDGCRELLRVEQPRAYRRLAWRDRKWLDCCVAGDVLRSRAFHRAAAGLFIVCFALRIIRWRYDLDGPAGDLLSASPVLLALPFMALARRRRLMWRLHFRDLTHRQTGAERG